MNNSFEQLVVKSKRSKTASELATESPDALAGVSKSDAEHLQAAFGIETIRDLARSQHIEAAKAIVAAAEEVPGYDPGPPPVWESLFAAAPLSAYESRPDLFRTEFGPVFYRGRLDGTAHLLIVGQDPSVNEILASKAFVGQSGQRLQGFLAKLGVTRSYLMLNTFSFSIFDQFGGDNEKLSHEDPILGYRNSQLDLAAADNPVQAIVTVGNGARDAVDHWPEATEFPRVHITHPAAPNTSQLLQNWNQGLGQLRSFVTPDDGATQGPDYGLSFVPGDVLPIPRRDLPFGIPAFHGDGDHARRNGNDVIEWHRNPV
jgi:uracil-DNA glycosylase